MDHSEINYYLAIYQLLQINHTSPAVSILYGLIEGPNLLYRRKKSMANMHILMIIAHQESSN